MGMSDPHQIVPREGFGYSPALDGIRALAVSAAGFLISVMAA